MIIKAFPNPTPKCTRIKEYTMFCTRGAKLFLDARKAHKTRKNTLDNEDKTAYGKAWNKLQSHLKQCTQKHK